MKEKRVCNRQKYRVMAVFMAASMLWSICMQPAMAENTLKITNSAAPGSVGTEVVTLMDDSRKIVNNAKPVDTQALSGTLRLSVQDAVNLAMEHNDNIKSAALEAEKAGLSLNTNRASYQLGLMSGTFATNDAEDQASYGISQLEVSDSLYQRKYDLTKESVAVAVQKLYWNILLNQNALDLDAINLKYAEQQYRNMELKHTVGMITDTVVLQYKTSWEAAKATKVSDEGALQTAIDSLKKQIGVNADAELVLTDSLPEFTPLVMGDIESYITQMVNKAPTVEIADLQVDIAEYAEKAAGLDLYASILPPGYVKGYDYNSTIDDTKRQAAISTETAQISRETTKKTLADTIRSTYYDILTKEANYASVKQAMATATEALKVKQQMLELGMATSLDVLEAEKTCMSYANTYRQILIGHALDLLTLEHPWC